MESRDRVILHCDMNGFYASVELLDRPDLEGKPVAVCGDPDSRHGIILAKNELAKAAGVVTAETGRRKRSVLTWNWCGLTAINTPTIPS